MKAQTFGDFNQLDNDIEKFSDALNGLPEVMDKGAELIRDRAKRTAVNKGLHTTGKGVDGIVYERDGDDRLIGWAKRPNFHLYFHEIGTYKDPARPHLRPAGEESENEVIELVRRETITGIKI